MHLEGRKNAPSRLGKQGKHWCFHNPNTSRFSKPPAWRPARGAVAVRGKMGRSHLGWGGLLWEPSLEFVNFLLQAHPNGAATAPFCTTSFRQRAPATWAAVGSQGPRMTGSLSQGMWTDPDGLRDPGPAPWATLSMRGGGESERDTLLPPHIFRAPKHSSGQKWFL